MTFTDLAKSFARTVIPYLVALVIGQALRVGLDLHGYEAQLTVGVGTCYYAAARLAERYLSPQFGWLLGVAAPPQYGSKMRRLKAPPILLPSIWADAPMNLTATVGYVKSTRTVVLPESPSKHGGRLGRHVEHDERSRAFRVAPHPAPKSVMWRRHVRPFDQGDLGSCTGNAMAGALSTAPFPHHFAEATALMLYKAATRLDDVPGSYPPDDTGSSGLAVAKAAVARGWIRSYAHCFSLDDVIAALQDGPVIAGTNWHTGMDTPDPDGLVRATGAVRGGHEYELVGVDLDARRFHAVNSWGRSWGLLGCFSIGFDDFARLLAEDGDVTVPRLT